VRGALGAVIARTLDAPGSFDADGWLRIGLCGHQPNVGETSFPPAVSSVRRRLVPLGLPPFDPFWPSPAQPWTAAKGAAWRELFPSSMPSDSDPENQSRFIPLVTSASGHGKGAGLCARDVEESPRFS
jgi:hypothetical protein